MAGLELTDQVRVAIDESGQDSELRQVDDTCAFSVRAAIRFDRLYTLTADRDDLCPLHVTLENVDETSHADERRIGHLRLAEPEGEICRELRHVHLGSLQSSAVVPVHRLPPRELVEHPHARLTRTVPALPVAAERQVGFG